LVKQLYFSILRDEDAAKDFLDVESELKRLQETIIPKYSIGRVPPFDLVKVKSAMADLQRTDGVTRAQLIGERKQLAEILGISDLSTEPIDSVPTVPDATEQNFSANPTLQSLSEEIAASQFGVKAAKASRLPEFTGALEYGRSGQTSDTTSLGWDISAGAKLSLFNWGQISSQIAQEKSSANLARNKLQIEEQNVRVDLAQTKALAKAHLADFRTLKELLPQTHESAKAATSRYSRGATGILEASDAIDLWLQSLLNERSAYYAYLSDLAKIERLIGRDSVQYEK
jgi:outer membrane protein TolC